MDDVTRRQAMKLAATTGAITTGVVTMGTNSAAAQDEGGGRVYELSMEGDQSIKLTQGEEVFKPSATTLGNNCGQRKREIENRFDVVAFGPCNHPTPIDAQAYALTTLLPQVIAQGGVLNLESGSKTVKNTAGPISFNTYLSYAGGDQI